MANIMRLGGGGGGAKLAVTLNEDGTQNLLISDNGTVFDLASLTADADAAVEDVTAGKVFYAQGKRLVGTADNAPVLLWTNASPTIGFAKQDISVNGSGYSAYIIECKFSTVGAVYSKGLINIGSDGSVASGAGENAASNTRAVTATSATKITFGDGYSRTNGLSSNTVAIPTRIWGVKFTL